jgi:hypothetical protein
MEGFVPDDLLASLLRAGHATREGALLEDREGRRYLLEDAVRVVGCREQDNDPYGYTGMVESIGTLLRRGFVVSAHRMAINRLSYDIELGVQVQPLALDEHTAVKRRAG